MDHTVFHSDLNWVSWICLVDGRGDDEHIINSDTDKHKWKKVVDSS